MVICFPIEKLILKVFVTIIKKISHQEEEKKQRKKIKMGVPHSISTEKKPTKVTLFFTVEEIQALHNRFRQLVPQNRVVFLENFTAYCLWSTMCRTPETAKLFFRAFDTQQRGYFDFEDFCLTTGALTRGTSNQLAEVLFRMLSDHPMDAKEANEEVRKQEVMRKNLDNPFSSPSETEKSSSEKQNTTREGPYISSIASTNTKQFIRYQDVIDCIQALDETFVCLKCDGGVSAQSVAARSLPFDEHGHLSLEDLKEVVSVKL